MNYSLIVAYDDNMVIGDDKGNLPFDLKSDLKNFKKVTMGNIVIMGRKTYESLPVLFKGRIQIVLTSDKCYEGKLNDCITVCSSISEIESYLSSLNVVDKEVIIMGGGEIYKQFLPYCNKLYITEVEGEFSGTVKFPVWDKSCFDLIKSESYVENGIRYSINEYVK